MDIFFFQTNTTSRKALIVEECSVLMSLTHLVDFLKTGLEFVLVSLQVRFQIMVSVSSEEDMCPAKPPTLRKTN